MPPGISGAWYNPAQPGHGLTVEILNPQSALLFWHVFDPDGNPVHLYIEGDLVGSEIRGRAYLGRGMRFGSFDPSEHDLQYWGRVVLDFQDCNAAHLSWVPSGPAGAGFVQGEMDLVRLTAIAGLACGGTTPAAGLYAAAIRSDAADAGATLLLGDDGSAWLFGHAAAYQSSFVFGGALGAGGSLQLEGATEPAIVEYAPEEPNAVAQLDLSALDVMAGASPGAFAAELPGGAELAFAPSYAVFRRTLSLQALAGRYTVMHGFLSAIHRELILADDGSFSGRDYGQGTPEACSYTGALALVPGTVDFTVDASVQGCGERDGAYQGRGYLAEVDNYFGTGKWWQLRFAALARDDDGEPRSAFQFEGLRQDGSAGGEGE